MFKPSFKIGEITTNDFIVKAFQCGNMGGMRLSKKTQALVLITDHTKGLYDDMWQGDILHYTGMGKSGDQSLEFMQNRTLAHSNENDIDVFLFEVITKGQYIFRGQVELAESPYQSIQKGEDGLTRKVWIFPLRLLDGHASITPDEFKELQNAIQRKAKKIAPQNLKKAAKDRQQRTPTYRIIDQAKVFVRDPIIAQYAKERAAGICQLCNTQAPFKDNDGYWYLESHHIEWLSCGGGDTLENTSALCPNCHRKMHILNLPEDVALLKRKTLEAE